MIAGIFFLIVLIALNAFFAASEIALISLNDNKIKIMADDGDKTAKILVNLLSEPSRFLATIQIGITLAGFLASAFASEYFSDPLVKLLVSWGVPVAESVMKTIAVIVITIILSYFSLVMGELVPKRIAMNKAERIAWIAAKPLLLLSKITAPFVKLLTVSMNFFVRLFGVDPNAENEHVTEEEIRMMVDVGEEKGTIHETERVMINNVFEFNNKTVSEVMTHRTDIAALPIEASLEEVIAFITSEKYSRIPVYDENIDNIVGVLQSKYLFQFLINNNNSTDKFNLSDVIRQPYFVPDSKRTDELFKELQQKKTHLAVIIDEYGGTAGIVTLEDLIEEIVGNIFDEDDEFEQEIEKLDENTYMIFGSTSLDTVVEYLDVELPIEEYETLSGFLVGQLGRIPENDEKPTVEFNGLIFKIEKVDEKRIAKVKVCKT